MAEPTAEARRRFGGGGGGGRAAFERVSGFLFFFWGGGGLGVAELLFCGFRFAFWIWGEGFGVETFGSFGVLGLRFRIQGLGP